MLPFVLMAGFVMALPSGQSPQPETETAYQKHIDSVLEANSGQVALRALLLEKTDLMAARNYSHLVVCLNNIARLAETVSPHLKAPSVEEALKIGRQHLFENHPALGMTYQLKGELFLENKDLDPALLWFRKAEEILKNTGQWNNYAWSLYFQALVNYYQGRFWEMEPVLLTTLEIAKKHLPADNIVATQCFQLMGALSQATGDFEQALSFAKMALEYRLRLPRQTSLDSIFLSDDYNNIANIYSQTGAYQEAHNYYRQSIELRRNIADAEAFSLAQSLNNIADLYYKEAEYQEAISWFKRALVSCQLLNPTRKKELFPTVCKGLASCFAEEGEIDSALYFIHLADPKHPHRHSLTKARIYLKAGQLVQALTFIRMALERDRQKQTETKGKGRAIIEFELGKTHLALEQQDSALYWCQSALYRLSTHFSDRNGLSNPKADQLIAKKLAIEILRVKARALALRKAPGDVPLALESLKLAFELTEALRQSYLAEGSKHFISREIKEIADQAIELCMLLHKEEKTDTYIGQAFRFSEKSRAILLLESVHSAEMRTFSYIPDSIRVKEAAINRALSFYEAKIGEAENTGERDSLKMKTWNDKVFSLQRQKEDLLDQLKQQYPEYFDFQYHYEIAGPGELQAHIREDEVMVEYFIGQHFLYCFAIRPDRVDMEAIPIPPDFDSLLNQFHQAISDHDFVLSHRQEAWDRYIQLAPQLFQTLFPASLFPEDTLPSRMTIIPNGNLNFIPFEALLTTKIEGSASPNYLRLPYLIRKTDINYAWSGSLLLNSLKRTHQPHAYVCLAMAPGSGLPLAENRSRQLRGPSPSNSSLPGAQDEVRAIADFLEGAYYFGEDATKKRFESEAKDYSILHLAMHGVPDLANPLASHLMFAGETDSAKLQAWEIYNLRLSADLVVLSACETGYGKLVQGEGVMSLARSFVQAGASSVVTTLWKVDDRSSSLMMKEFYRNLADGDDKAIALHKAKISFLDNADSRTAHPIFWAGYIHKGNSTAIAIPTPFPWKMVLVIVLGIVILVFFGRILRDAILR